jgi:hypothetical protein
VKELTDAYWLRRAFFMQVPDAVHWWRDADLG